jgi:beta-glucosidase
MSNKLIFPDNFLWGTATSAYQVEGGINNSDWSEKFPANKACDHYNRYQEDFDLLKKMNQNAYRFSIEWSRIEPEQGKFNEEEIEHYRKVLSSLKKRKIKTMVTLHHFTNPLWFSRKGGWANSQNSLLFVRFAQRMLKEYGDLVDFWITINEPLIYCSKSFLEGSWPHSQEGVFVFLKAIKNQISAHQRIFKAFHEEREQVKVGIAKNNQFFEPANEKSFLDRISCFMADYFWNEYFLGKIEKSLDFIGLNYYFYHKVKFPFSLKKENKRVSDLGWDIHPQGLLEVLKELGEYNLPIYITENGLADQKDEKRQSFIKDHLTSVHKAIMQGVDVRGYFHWSLIDNFEWDKGFKPRFGLVEVKRKDLSREPRPSASYYSQICLNNYLID